MATRSTVPSVIFLSPDASRTGAPLALLHLLRWLKASGGLDFRIVLYQNGPLAADFSTLASTMTLTEVGIGRSGLVRKIGKVPVLGKALKSVWHKTVAPRTVGSKPAVIYANSVASARLIRQTVPEGTPLIVHVHELENAIRMAAGEKGMTVIKSLATRYVAMSRPVRDNLIANHGIDPALIDLVPSFLPVDEMVAQNSATLGLTMRQRFNIPQDALVVAGCGATDRRKGVDLFVEMAGNINSRPRSLPVHFFWVGKNFDDDFTAALMRRVQELELSKVIHFTGEQPKPLELFCGCDVFVLSSREEPMGLVALEAASVGKPIICFGGAGGMPDFVGSECGVVVSPMNADALADAVEELLASETRRTELGRRAFEKVRRVHHVDVVAPQILNIINRMANA